MTGFKCWADWAIYGVRRCCLFLKHIMLIIGIIMIIIIVDIIITNVISHIKITVVVVWVNWRESLGAC